MHGIATSQADVTCVSKHECGLPLNDQELQVRCRPPFLRFRSLRNDC